MFPKYCHHTRKKLARGEEGDVTEPFKSMNYIRKRGGKEEVEKTVLNTTSFLKHGAFIIYMGGYQPALSRIPAGESEHVGDT